MYEMQKLYQLLILLMLLLAWNHLIVGQEDSIQDFDLNSLESHLNSLKGSFADVRTANELFGIPYSAAAGVKCSPLIARVSSLNTLSENVYRPQMLISGAIHGDERVGPIASLFVAKLLVYSAECEVLKVVNSCQWLADHSISEHDRIWLTFLATTRDTYIIPAANCHGYSLRRREDMGVDPNRDFAYGRSDTRCLRSSSAQVLAALFDAAIIQLVVTFHGGMEAVAYEWGSGNHPKPLDNSPDETAFKTVAIALRDAAGTAPGVPLYPVGRMNSLVYSVEGGMEDWMYAAGWDTRNIKNCSSMRHNLRGYQRGPVHQPVAKAATETLRQGPQRWVGEYARAAVFLVETSNRKSPFPSMLGTANDILNISSVHNGHVPRNVRLSAAAIDWLEPYVCLSTVQIRPKQALSGSLETSIRISWFVGGASRVDNTRLILVKIGDPNNHSEQDLHLGIDNLDAELLNVSTIFHGTGRFGSTDPCSAAEGQGDSCFKSEVVFRGAAHPNPESQFEVWNGATGRWHALSSTNRYQIIAIASVDDHWGEQGQGFPTSLRPQSYYTRARTDVRLESSNIASGRSIRGRRYWMSKPISLVYDSTTEKLILLPDIVFRCAWWSPSHAAYASDVTAIATRSWTETQIQPPRQLEPSMLMSSVPRPNRSAGDVGTQTSKQIPWLAILGLTALVILVLSYYRKKQKERHIV